MKTLIIEVTDENDPLIQKAAQILRDGGTVIFPTETVYGLGANALSEEAVHQVYRAKGRPSDNPLIVHLAEWSQIYDLVAFVPDLAKQLADAFWPGPLTIILPKREIIPTVVTGKLETVAVRIPGHPVARKLIALAGVPVAAPSANLSGKPSPTRSEHVLLDMTGRVDCILCGGEAVGGVESTVLDMTVTPPVILRPGGVTVEQLEELLPAVVIDPALEQLNSELAPKSPGMKYTHYAPDAQMQIYEGSPEMVVRTMQSAVKEARAEGKRVAVLGLSEYQAVFEDMDVVFFALGSETSPQEAAHLLFHCLRSCNEARVDLILAQAVPEKGIGRAVMNRMRKAAGNHVVVVDRLQHFT